MDATEVDARSKVKKHYVNFWKWHVKPKYGNNGNEALKRMTRPKCPPRKRSRPRPMRKGRTPWRKFKGNCNYCGTQGHKAVDCFEKKSSSGINSKKENRKCFNCNVKGNITRDKEGRTT
jgi:hypothetical protein